MGARLRPMHSPHVQYGCGWHAPEAWLNFDASPTLRVERTPILRILSVRNPEPFPANVRYGDIVAGLPIADGSCELLYCSHVLEHLSLDDFTVALSNSFTIMAPGAVWRMVLPDLRLEAERYLADAEPAAAEAFMRATGLGVAQRPRRIADRLRQALGHSRHLWMWDFESLSARLDAAGFCEIRRAVLGDSMHDEFAVVEDRARWDNALGVECMKPQ